MWDVSEDGTRITAPWYRNIKSVQYSNTKGEVYIWGTRFLSGLDKNGGAWFGVKKFKGRWVFVDAGDPSPVPQKDPSRSGALLEIYEKMMKL